MKIYQIITSLALLLQVAAVNAQQAPRGQEVPNIADPRLQVKLPDVNGDSLSLISYKGKVVLLDFWASWCMPCRAANKKLVKIYSKYKDKGFEVYGVSLDEEQKDWVKAIAKDKITWLQVREHGNAWEAKVAQQWAISAIPTSFLINKKGDIVAMNLESDELEKAVKELLEE
ncbi:MAG: TlpA family protein disulfide reductase [Chitinophagaceae bacterium]|nr:MAG: TlpA family protein disulfide reductase [Chitinophagaceae bacterium]